jgi:ParB-like chromosome segregation protein Spo0J
MKTIKLMIHPEYERLVPPLSREEYSALRDSIKEEGLHYPLIINSQGIILDGHNRFKACAELGVMLAEKDWIVKEFGDPPGDRIVS